MARVTSTSSSPNLGLDLSKPFTIEANVMQGRDQKLSGWPSVVYWSNRVAISNGDRWRFKLIGANDGQLPHVVTSGPIVNGKWVHLAGVFNGKQISFFVDGALIGVKDTTQDPPAQVRTDLNIGFDFGGLVNEVRISKKARYDKPFTPAKRSTRTRTPLPSITSMRDRAKSLRILPATASTARLSGRSGC